MAREIGDKLGPRLSKLLLNHNLALRTQLAPIEAKIAAAATKVNIDLAGEEIAGLWRPITSAVIAHHGDKMPPELAHLFGRMASGKHQWEAISGNLQMASTSALSSVLSNYLFPITGALNEIAPSLPLDAQTGAAAVAAGLASMDAGVNNAAVWGNTEQAFTYMYQLAQAIPGGAQLFDLFNRGLISDPDLAYWLTRSALPPQLVPAIKALAAQLTDPADAALAVLRNIMTTDDGYKVAAQNGLSNSQFDILVDITGEPPAIEEMVSLNRRGLLSDDLLTTAILQSRIRDQWIPYVKLLGVIPPTGAEVMNALVQGQVSEADALTRWTQAGGDPAWFETAYASTANSPAPVELAEMANRGIIPWQGTGAAVVSWEEGFLEGRWKDKWAPAFQALSVYHPPPREVGTLVKEGGVTQDEAMLYWAQSGMTPDLAHEYWLAAHYSKTATAHALAQSEIIKLYEDQAISRDTAKGMLTGEGWAPGDAEYLLDIADFSVAKAALEGAISKIKGLFVAYKIPSGEAAQALATLEVPASQANQLMAIWGLEQAANLKVLTAAEITDAWFYQIIPDPQDAQAELQAIGYTAHDAWVLLNVKNKALIADYPDPG
jgi:hypothetical protein